MKKSVLATLAVAGLTLSMVPTAADELAQRDRVALLAQAHQRFIPKDPGTLEDLSFVYGPFAIGPGADRNLITAEVPLTNVHLVAVAPELVDAADGSIPTEQQAHIHHAHWFTLTSNPGDRNCYTAAGDACLAWVFGTGEEKTQGRFTDRADVVPAGIDPLTDPDYQSRPHYGIYIDGAEPQALIFMVHNKTAAPMNVFVVLDVTVMHGTADQIQDATGRPMHTVRGTLWGQTTDATPDFPYLRSERTFNTPGTAIASGSHVHPGGKEVYVANLGPNGACRGTDPDGDGYPGVTILRSPKFDRTADATPFSEDYQMGATKFGWRAPVREGDVLAQYAPYAIFGDPVDNGQLPLDNPATFSSADGLDHAWYEAMTYTGIYIAADEPPPPVVGDVCSVENLGPTLIGEDTFEKQGWSGHWPANDGRIADLRDRFELGTSAGMINHLWVGPPDPVCNGSGCEANRGVENMQSMDIDTVHIAGFFYMPGDLGLSGPMAQIPVVQQGAPLRFINEDIALGIRHSVTSCPLPCDGSYVANYPAPDGVFDSGKLGNLDYIDGGLWGLDQGRFERSMQQVLYSAFGEDYPWYSDERSPRHHETMPFYDLDTSDLDPGRYTYFCRMHPTMRGTFEVAAA